MKPGRYFRGFLLLALSWGGFLNSACASLDGILDGRSLKPVTLADALAPVKPGSVVVVGENHGLSSHQNQQLAILEALRRQGLQISVGMEFFNYPDQALVDQYREGALTEADFLTRVAWGSPDFSFYRPQVLFPRSYEGSKAWALNAPRSLTSKVAKSGLASLNPQEQALLPPNFALGRESYRQRFLSLMPHLPSPEAGERYFAAQSIWDDTMAWRAAEFITQNPDQVLVIIVGDFHVQYGGGLPDRLRARGPQVPVWSFSLVNTQGLSSEEILKEIQPDSEGPRADVLWLSPL